jgi:DNA-binding response OmpR family regulator
MSKRILILEDSDTDGEFSYKQFRVLVTSDAKSIITTTQMFHPDLVIMDYHTAGHTSEDICRQIQWRRQFGHIPVILSSAYLYDAVDFAAMGYNDIIFKPFELDELINKATSLVLL